MRKADANSSCGKAIISKLKSTGTSGAEHGRNHEFYNVLMEVLVDSNILIDVITNDPT